MKFGQEYQQAFAAENFPDEWRESAIQYKQLKKVIKKVHRELSGLGLDAQTIRHLNEWIEPPQHYHRDPKDYYSAAVPTLDSVVEEFSPQLRVLVDGKTGEPLDATLAPETKDTLQKLARHEMMSAGRRDYLGVQPVPANHSVHRGTAVSQVTEALPNVPEDARWVQVPLATAKDFFDLLEPKLQELEALRTAETKKLESDILDLGDAVENVIQPVKDGYEATRKMSYRDLYFWREMFRLYLEKPVFYSETEARRGALTFNEAKSRLQAYDTQLRETGLLAKMKTPQAKIAAQQFLDLNLNILKIMHFQEMNARAMTKILKKFDKRTHLEGRLFLKDLAVKYPALTTNSGKQGTAQSAGGFANSIARDLSAEITTKVLAIVPQLDDWNCPVCYSMAWRPVSLGCCSSVFCITCIIKLQEDKMKRCPVCNQETVMRADGRNINFDAMDFLQKYFPMEVKKRQKENEKEALVRTYGADFVRPGCSVQ
jgi:E3 ubiquitin-protein ligase BAH